MKITTNTLKLDGGGKSYHFLITIAGHTVGAVLMAGHSSRPFRLFKFVSKKYTQASDLCWTAWLWRIGFGYAKNVNHSKLAK